MPSINKPVSFTPRDGGKLITRSSYEMPGFANYVAKLDFRRDFDQEIRAEGHELFQPNRDIPIGRQPYPQEQDFAIDGFLNGGFEQDNNLDGTPDGWDLTLFGSATFDLDSNSSAGALAAKFISAAGSDYAYLQSSAFLPATDGRFWRLNWKHRASVGNIKILIEVYWFDSDLSPLPAGPTEVFSSESGNPTGSYQSFFANITIPAGAAYGKLRLYGKHSGSATFGSVWYDEVSMVEKGLDTLPITLLHQARRPNGQMAAVAGTKRTLYRYIAPDDSGYVSDVDDGGYITTGEDYVEDYISEDGDSEYADDYFGDEEGQWKVIGDGFAEDLAQRWEALNINGWAIFNNGIDLPQTFRVEDSVAKPNYEMREAGIAYVGTIWEHGGQILMAGDIASLRSDRIEQNFAHTYGVGQVRQHGSVFSYPFTAEKFTGYAVRGTGAGNVVVPNDASIQTYAAGITLEGTIRISNATAANMIIEKGLSPGGCFRIKIENGVITAEIETAGNALVTAATDWIYGVGEWIHVAMTYDPAIVDLRLYIEGKHVASDLSGLAEPQSMFSNTEDVVLANSGGGHTVDIAEFRIWTDVRTPDEILANMATDVSGSSNLAAYWKFDEGTGSTAVDDANANDGTLAVGALWVSSDAPCDSYIEISDVAAITNGLTRSGGTATFEAVRDHKLTTGDLVSISGANDANYNIIVAVTVLDRRRFTYAVGGAPPTPDPGSPVVRRAWFGAASFNYDAMVGKKIKTLGGLSATIVGVISKTRIKVNRSVESMTVESLFHIVNDTTSELTGTVSKNGTTIVTGVGTLFTDELYPGASIIIPGGGSGEEVRIVESIASNTSLTVAKVFAGTASGQTGSILSDYLLIHDDDEFSADMVGKYLFFTDGNFRKVVEFVSTRLVRTQHYTPVIEQDFKIENTTAYLRIDNGSYFNRVQYQRAWSSLEEPLRFSATTPGSMSVGSSTLELNWQMRSLEPGDTILVLGAGTAGGNLTANIVYVHPNHTTFILDKVAQATTVDQLVGRADAAGSIAGYDYLQDDGSAIIKGMDLQGTMVIYKDTGIFLDKFTGNPTAPFAPIRRVEYTQDSIYFRNTLAKAGRFHIYRGKNAFYKFDLTSQAPEPFLPLERCADIFKAQARLEDTNLIFAFDNPLTQEIFFCFPSTSDHGALCFDYQYGECRTTGARFTAGAAIKQPQTGALIGPGRTWVILGGDTGAVMRYGKADEPEEHWGGRDAIFNRNGSGYTSRLKSGLYGDRFFETIISEWMAELATQAYPNATAYTFNLYSYANAAEAATLVDSVALPDPAKGNLVSMHYLSHFFQDEIVVEGANNPLRLAARTVAFSKVRSRGHQKAGL